MEERFVDMVAEGFVAGIRFGGTVPDGMIAAHVADDLDWVVVAAPRYLDARGRPKVPQDLMRHDCIRIRMGTNRLYRWELGQGEQAVSLDVPGYGRLGDSELSL